MRKIQSLIAPSHQRPAFLKRFACALGLLVFGSLCTPVALATEVYAYLGSDYTSAHGIFTTSDYVSGVFTTSTVLGPNLQDASVIPLSYSFGDGVYDWTPSDSYINNINATFTVSTDAYGTPTAVTIDLFNGLPLAFGGNACIACTFEIAPTGDSVLINFILGGSGGSASNTTAGEWGPDFDPPSTPEPATAALTLAVLIAFAFSARRRIARSIR